MWNLTIVNQLFLLLLFSAFLFQIKVLAPPQLRKAAVCVVLLTASYQNQFIAVFANVEQDKEIEILDIVSTV